MIACTFWENVFQFSLTDQDERVTKESTMFMSKLLETTVACDENFCDEVIKRIMSPLGENTYRSIKASTDLGDVSDEVAPKHLKPALKLIGDILQHFLEGVLFDREDYRVVFSFLKNFHVEQRISDFYDHSTIEMSCLRYREDNVHHAVPGTVPASCHQEWCSRHSQSLSQQNQKQLCSKSFQRDCRRFYRDLQFRDNSIGN
jgi:hypothetical protein